MNTTRRIRREAKELFGLCLVNGMLDENRVRQVARTILHSKHRGYLMLLSDFHRLIRLKREHHTAQVASAVPLSADLQFRLKAGLERIYGSGLSVRFTHDPSLIGGMRVVVGSDVYDGSVRYRLAVLDRSFSTPGLSGNNERAI